MSLSFGEHTVQLQRLNSKMNLEEALTKCLAGSLIVGDDAEQQNEYYSVQICSNSPGEDSKQHVASESSCFCIGIISEGLGLQPQVLPIPELSLLLCGFNDRVMAFNVNHRKIVYQLKLNRSPFRSFLHLRELNIVLVFHEIGLVALGEDGRVLWRFDRDVITNSSIDGQAIYLEFMDCPSAKIDVRTGSESAGSIKQLDNIDS